VCVLREHWDSIPFTQDALIFFFSTLPHRAHLFYTRCGFLIHFPTG